MRSLNLLLGLFLGRRLKDLGQVVSLQCLIVVGYYTDAANALRELSMKDMKSVVRLTYCVDLNQDEHVWVLEVDLVSGTNNRGDLLYNLHALHDGVIANCRADGKLEQISVI